MIKKFFKAFFVLFIFFIAGCQVQSPTNSNQAQNSQAAQPAVELKAYDLQEIGKHSSKEDCWLLIDGKVYDVTVYIATHPGGQAILQGCGKDSTELFNARPMGSGTPHSEKARQRLDQYLIGELQR